MKPSSLGLKSPGAARLRRDDVSIGGVVINVQGDEKSGKNHFAYGAPAPVAVLSGDRRDHHVRRKYPDKEIWTARFTYELPAGADVNTVAKIVRPIWHEFESLYWELLRGDRFRTIVVDTGTFWWQTCQLAKFGKFKQVPPILRDSVNAIWERMMLKAEEYDKCVLWLHRLHDEWINVKRKGQMVGERTGRRIRHGQKSIGFNVQVNVETFRDNDEFCARVIDNAIDAQWNGFVFRGNQCNFASMMATLSDTDESVWE